MELKITYNVIDDENVEFKAKFKNKELLISKDSEKWNTVGINEFLVLVASSIPIDSEELTLEYDKDFDNEIYKHICGLFKEFVDEFNRTNISND